ncbi:MAG TPA: NAD(P)-dependent oxidoreductase [Gemmatimonadaceae bacterium]|nr:NAD(P)-dependent oxidoreductase [Gemmatimonadaceae bacterium]
MQSHPRSRCIMNVAFLGLGAIGAPMARHVAAPPFSLAVWNRTADVAARFAAGANARHATSPADAARGAEIVITCLPTSREVEALLDGADGLQAAMQPGSVLVDCTSGDPASSRRIASMLASRGVAFVDAPVSGGVSGAERGALTVMCGGSADDLARVRPVLERFGEKVVHCGEVGAGHAVKAINQAMLAVHIWSLSEGLAALASAGVNVTTALDVINASSGRSNTSMNLFPERVLTRAFPRTFKLALLDKDARIAAGFAREHGVPSPMLQLASELMRTGHAVLGEEADHVEAVRVVEAWAGVQVGADVPTAMDAGAAT